MSSISLHGEAASASVQEAAHGISELRLKFTSFDKDCISNVDETGLLFKLLPRQT